MSNLAQGLQKRKSLIYREQSTNDEILSAFRESYKVIQSSLDKLLLDIEERKDRGEIITPQFLFEQARLTNLLEEISIEINKLSLNLGKVTTKAKRQSVAAAILEATSEIEQNGLKSSITGLDSEAIKQLVGIGGNGDPLSILFNKLQPEIVQSVKNSLITGVAIGSGAPEIAREIKNTLGTSTAHALTIARTETNRAYRESSRIVYQENKQVLGYVWISARDLRTCAICWAMHGRVFKTSEKFATHPNCRCTLVAKLADSEEIKTGEDEFGELSKEQQKAILGSKRFELYQSGKNKLSSFVGEKNTEFGKVRFIRPLDQIQLEGGDKKAKSKTTPKTPKVAKPKVVKEDYSFKNHQEAEKFFEKKYPSTVFDFAGMNMKVLNPTLKSFDALAQQFPEVMDRLKYMGTYKNKPVPYTERLTIDPMNKKSIYRKYIKFTGENAHASVDGRRLAPKSGEMGNFKQWSEQQDFGAGSGYYSKYRKGRVDSTVIHEFGHLVEGWLKTFFDKGFADAWTNDGRSIWGDAYAKHRKKYKPTKTTSRYATRNDAEGFAEAFASIIIEPKSVWSKEVTALDKLIKGFRKLEPHLIDFNNMKNFATLSDAEKARVRKQITERLKEIGLEDSDF